MGWLDDYHHLVTNGGASIVGIAVSDSQAVWRKEAGPEHAGWRISSYACVREVGGFTGAYCLVCLFSLVAYVAIF